MRRKKPRICSENDIHKHEKTNSPTQVQKQYTRSDPHTPRDAQKANDRRQEMEKVDRKCPKARHATVAMPTQHPYTTRPCSQIDQSQREIMSNGCKHTYT